MSSHDPLVQLRRLDMASPEFNDQLCHIIDAEEYKQGVQKLEGDDLVWFVDYLNKVRRCASILRFSVKPSLGPRLSSSFQFRFSEVSTRTEKDM